MYDLCIFTALAWERSAVAATLGDLRPAGTRRWQATSSAGGTCLLLQTGVGPTRAAAMAAAAPPARCMIVCGCAGALVSDLAPGSVVVADAAHDADTHERFATLATPVVAWARRVGLQVAHGPIVTTSAPLPAELHKRKAGIGGAVAVDMESAAIARVAIERGVPIVVLRVVLDAVGDTLPPPGLVDEASGRLRLGAALQYFLPPHRWHAAVRLARRRRIAERGIQRTTALLLGPTGRSVLEEIAIAI